MFKHKETPPEKSGEEEKDLAVPAEETKTNSKPPESLEDLIKKNLKWSQIIYEQNRKINHKLVWAAIAEWLRLLIIVVPIILALIYLPPLLGNIYNQYKDVLGIQGDISQKPGSIESLLKMLNLDPAKQEQLKNILK